MFVQNVQAYVKQMLRNKEYFRTVFNLFFFELIYLSIKNQWVSFFFDNNPHSSNQSVTPKKRKWRK